jgi:UDPglucose 6-dehydrogenase
MDDQDQVLDDADALTVITDWNQFRNPDFNKIREKLKVPIILDGRNLFSSSHLAGLGFAYFGIGRPVVEAKS